MKKNSELEMLGEQHYIIPLPPSGIPAKIMRLIEDVREAHGGVTHVNIYQTPNEFRYCSGLRANGNKRYLRTTFWMELSNRPLSIREKVDWPVENSR